MDISHALIFWANNNNYLQGKYKLAAAEYYNLVKVCTQTARNFRFRMCIFVAAEIVTQKTGRDIFLHTVCKLLSKHLSDHSKVETYAVESLS
jgi:hypothetical protein